MNDKKLDEKARQLIFKQKTRCNMCYEIPIIKEIVNGGGLSYFITAECLNKHGVFFCALKDFCSDKNQIDKIKCHNCANIQGIVDFQSKLFHSCKECHKFLCQTCFSAHYKKFQNSHHTTRIDDLDYICKEHGIQYTGFCTKCNINICNFCQQRQHAKHDKKLIFKDIMPLEQKIKEVSDKVETQKGLIDEINKILNDFLKIANEKIKEYQDNLNSSLKFNNQVFNCIDQKNPNYQSIVNFEKMLNIDISEISWISEIQGLLDKFIKLIKTQSSTISHEKTKNTTNNIDKDLMDTFKQSIIGNTNKPTIDVLQNEKHYDFTNNELLKEIGKKNFRIYKNEEIIGDLKDIYIMNECNSYLTLVDNGIFIFDQETNDLLSYIDVNDNLEYDEITNLSYYYNKNLNKIFLFLGTNTNKIKIYCINEKNDYSNELIQEIKLENLKNIFCNEKGDLLVFEEKSSSIYKFQDKKYEQEKEFIVEEKETKKLYSTENYLISCLKEKEKLIFYNKKDFEVLFTIDNIKNNENTQIIEISKNLILVSFKNIIQVIDVEKKSISFCHDAINMDYIESVDIFNNKEILLTSNLNNKLITYILELDEANKIFKEKKKIEDLDCKLIRKIGQNKIILYTKYGLNILEN